MKLTRVPCMIAYFSSMRNLDQVGLICSSTSSVSSCCVFVVWLL